MAKQESTRPQLTTVLVGTSLTVPSDPVVRTGVEIARRAGAKLHLFHAYTPPVSYFAAPTGLTTFDPQLLEVEQQMRQVLIEEQLARIDAELEEVANTSIVVGSPHRLLLEESHAIPADLIVIGASEGSEPRVLGSTADRVLRKATCPVLVVRGDLKLPVSRVLAPVDLSPHSEDSLWRGLVIVDALEGAAQPRIDALFVLTPEELKATVQFTAEQIDRLAHDELNRFIERFDPQRSRDIRPDVRTGEPREEIIRELEELADDLVVLGTHGRGGFERFLLGSVASDVAGRSPCSALIIPPGMSQTQTSSQEEE